MNRREFTTLTTGIIIGTASDATAGDPPKKDAPPVAPVLAKGPTEAEFVRDYPAPGFQPGWKKPQLNRQLVADFVLFAHTDFASTKKLAEKEPLLVNAFMDWGGGDWESALGGSSHMGRRDIVEMLLEKGARIDIFCAAMMGQLAAIQAFLTLQPKLIDAKGPHGFSLHFHAQVGGDSSAKVLDYLQSVKKIELRPNPFLKKPADAPKTPAEPPAKKPE